jgi:hypothetical protein
VSELPDTTLTYYVIADARGDIVHVGAIPKFMVASQPLEPGQSIVLGVGRHGVDYVLNGVITPRPTNPSTLAGMKISNVPNPSTVTIDGVNPQAVTDGEVDLNFTQPGVYTAVVASWPMLDATFTVTQH